MIVYVVLGVLAGVIVAGILPWALLRKMDREHDALRRPDGDDTSDKDGNG